jgi:hypothetical protein
VLPWRAHGSYSAVAVEESPEFMNDGATARKPIIGPLTTFGMRTALRITDRVPALKRKMALNMEEGAGRRAGVRLA